MIKKFFLTTAICSLGFSGFAADLDVNDIQQAIAATGSIARGTQFTVQDRAFEIQYSSYQYLKYEYTNNRGIPKLTPREYPHFPEHFPTPQDFVSTIPSFNVTASKSELTQAEDLGFPVPYRWTNGGSDLEIFVRSGYPEEGAMMFISARSIAPS